MMDPEEKKRRILSSILITIDGPAGSGKSTTASLLAENLGLTYLDTGAMYRAVAYAVLKAGIDPGDEEEVTALANGLNIEIRSGKGRSSVLLDGEDIESHIRAPEISDAVSPVSKHRGVRRNMVRIQRNVASRGGIVAEGRDTGTTVFPYADVKVFLVADIRTRASRRVLQLRSMGIEQDMDSVAANIRRRDEIDSSREHSPLLRPPGSIVVDTSGVTIEEQVETVRDAVLEAAGRLAELKVWPGERNRFSRTALYWRISRFFVRSFFRMAFGLRIYGTENQRYRENFIYASNHISYYDPPIVGSSLEREIWFMAKRELFRNRLFGWLIRSYHAIPVTRNEADRRSLKAMKEKLDRGYSILMFPEGTRSRTGKLRDIKSGLGFIALQNMKSVLPVHISGAGDLKNSFLRRKRLEVRIGRPIRLGSGYRPDDRKKDYKVLSDMVWEEMRMLRDESKA